MVLTTHTVERDPCPVVAVEGELDYSTASQLLDTLTTTIADHDASLILDLADLRFCDSSGLAVFVRTHNALELRGQRLVVTRPGPMLLRILELSGVDRAIAVTNDLTEAYAVVGSSAGGETA